MAHEHLVTLVTSPDAETARRIADALVNEGLAACVNIVPGLTSVYRWQGEVHHDAELLLVIKTSGAAFAGLRARVQALHPDDVPEIIAAPIVEGLDAYLAWVTEQSGGR